MKNILLITPDYTSHYNPLIRIGNIFKSKGFKVYFACGESLKQRVIHDGFHHINLVVGEESNSGIIKNERINQIKESFEATKRGMIETLIYQAENRLNDLLWEPKSVFERINTIVNNIKPVITISVQLSYNATLSLISLNIPFVTFVTGHPLQLPFENETYGFIDKCPSSIKYNTEKKEELEEIAIKVQNKFTHTFNKVLNEISGKSYNYKNAFSVSSDRLVLFNYPEKFIKKRKQRSPSYFKFIGPLLRIDRNDKDFKIWLEHSKKDLPIIYLSFGTYFSVRIDVLENIVYALKDEEYRVVFSTGVLKNRWNSITEKWYCKEYLPQTSILRYCDLVITHGGNNTTVEAMSVGAKLIVLPFASDQFFGAVNIEEYNLGKVIDPNNFNTTLIKKTVKELLQESEKNGSYIKPNILNDDSIFNIFDNEFSLTK